MRYLALSLCFLLVACSGPAVQPRGGYPAEITSAAEHSNFPSAVAGYTRGKMFRYEPGMKNYSVAYDILEPQIHNAVTLYFYEVPIPLAQLFEAEKQQIIAAHPDATLLRESPMTLEKAGEVFHAYSAVFSYTSIFAQRKQTVFSQLILVAHPERYFKVRSTAPLGQATTAEAQTQQLLGEVNWAY